MPNEVGSQVSLGLIWFAVSYSIYRLELMTYDPAVDYKYSKSHILMLINLGPTGFFVGALIGFHLRPLEFLPPHLFAAAVIVVIITILRHVLVRRKQYRILQEFREQLIPKREKKTNSD